jgi:hypothetical protein
MFQITNKKYNPISRWEKIYSLLPSGYIRKGTLQVFHKIKRNYPDDYIVCIGYTKGDTQFALTETFKTYETSVEQVVDRCLQEECSMERIKTASSLDSLSFVYNEKYATIHCVPMRVSFDNLRPCGPDSVVADDINRDDDKTRKLVLILHGPLYVIEHVFSQFYSHEDDISHLVAIPVREVSQVFPKLFPLSLYPMMHYPRPPSFLPPIHTAPNTHGR